MKKIQGMKKVKWNDYNLGMQHFNKGRQRKIREKKSDGKKIRRWKVTKSENGRQTTIFFFHSNYQNSIRIEEIHVHFSKFSIFKPSMIFEPNDLELLED